MRDFRPQAAALNDQMITMRRDLHQHPELAFEEVRTAGIVAQHLTELGLEVQTGVGKTGVVGILEGDHDGPTVLVRVDMDALPIQEENEFDFRSLTDRKMHACGHDAHTTIGLHVATLLNAMRDQMHGRVKFIFQPAEEIGMGARAMIDDGALGDPRPDVSFAVHMWPDMPVGHILVRPGAMLPGAGIFTAEIKGVGGHAARPDITVDPVVAAAQITTALQSIVSRNVNPVAPAVVTVTQIIAGDAFNVTPNRATINGTFRTFTPAVRDLVMRRFTEIAEGVAQGMGCTADISISEPVPPVVNDEAVIERLGAAFLQTLPDFQYHTDFRTMVSEDMAYFLREVPGVYMFLGAGHEDESRNVALHHPRLDINEDVLVAGTAILAGAVSDYVLSD